MNTGAILVFDEDRAPSAVTLRHVLEERVNAVPRLRQRVRRPPLGCGSPVWVDDAGFSIDEHLFTCRLDASRNGRDSLLDMAGELVCRRLPGGQPPWRAYLVLAPTRGRVCAVVLVLNHVVTDGLGGLAVLGALADPGPPISDRPFPQPFPSLSRLAVDAASRRRQMIRHVPSRLLRGCQGLRELRVTSGARPVGGRSSLTRPTSGRRSLGTVEVPLAGVVSAAHQARGTVNDVVLAAIAGALKQLLAQRGEAPGWLVVSVPVSGRSSTDTEHLENATGVRPVAVPLIDDDRARLRAVVQVTRSVASAPRASSAAPLGLVFRTLSRLGLFTWFVNHQRFVDTFATNLRGPAEPLSLAGSRIDRVIPVAVNPGNVSVSFDILSYAGTLGITVVADPHNVPDLEALTRSLEHILRGLCMMTPV
jgi:diacylglycerol O-acyltransferase / wax synthase